MKKLKNTLLKICFAFVFFATAIIGVSAKTAFYTNSKGVEMTEEQYNYLSSMYSQTKINNFTQSQFDTRIYADSHTTEVQYIVEKEFKDNLGNTILSNVSTLSEEEYLEYKENENNVIMPYTSGNLSTSEVKMTLQIYSYSTTSKASIDLMTQWIKGVPSVKSFDVSAFLFTTTDSLQLARIEAEGYQDSDAGTVTYSNEGGNSKWDHNAYGTSMNIIDETKSRLLLEIGAEYYYFGSGTLKVTGTYQHATRDVTLAQSHSYNFSSEGCGGVVNFYNNVGNYYNSNPGVTVSHTIR